MGTYFVNPYKEYFEKLNTCTTIINECNNLISSTSISQQIIDNLNSKLKSSNWQELGYQELVSSSIPGISAEIQTIIDNLTDGLLSVCTISINELLPIVSKLKEEDEKHEELKNELANLTIPQRYDKKGNETQNYKNYVSRKASLNSLINNSKNLCEQYQNEANDLVSKIKNLDSSIKQSNISDYISDDLTSNISIVSTSNLDNLLTINYNGTNYNIVDTKIPVVEYSNYIQKNKMYQNAGALGGQCMIASQIYARDLLRGTYTSKEDFVNMEGSPATRINEKVCSQNKDEVLQYVYNEIQEGHPVVLQVTQKRSNEGLRHLVTVVGFKEGVNSYSQLNSENILVLDNVDGKIQTLSERNRDLYNQGGNGYYALGPAENFLAKEVYNITYSNA